MLFKPTCNTCITSRFLHSLEPFFPDETPTLNQSVHPLLQASTILIGKARKYNQGYANLSLNTARSIFFSVTTDCNVSRILAHLSSKFTMLGLCDIFIVEQSMGSGKCNRKEEQLVRLESKSVLGTMT